MAGGILGGFIWGFGELFIRVPKPEYSNKLSRPKTSLQKVKRRDIILKSLDDTKGFSTDRGLHFDLATPYSSLTVWFQADFQPHRPLEAFSSDGGARARIFAKKYDPTQEGGDFFSKTRRACPFAHTAIVLKFASER